MPAPNFAAHQRKSYGYPHVPQIKPSRRLKRVIRKVVQGQLVKQVETKYSEFTATASGFDFSGVIYSLTDIAQGATDQTRNGDELLPTSLDIRMQLVAGDATQAARFMIVRWLPYTTGAPSITAILQGTGSALAPYQSFYHDQRDQFEVLMDKFIKLDTYHPTFNVRKRLKLAKKMVKYTAGSTTNASNKLFVVLISDSGAAPNPSFSGVIRTNFSDI